MSAKLWVVSAAVVLVIALAAGCAGAATTTPAPSPSPTAKPTSTSSPTATAPSPSPAPKTTATAPGASFAGKTITIVVPTAPGGGGDIFGRLMATNLPRVLPGNPTVVVRNIVGGGQTIGSNYVYTAKPDGLTLLAAGGTVNMGYLLGLSAVKYDLMKMPAIIGLGQGSVYFARSQAADAPEALLTGGGLVYGSSVGASMAMLLISLKELTDFPTKFVMGYGGAGDVRRAFLSGEVNFMSDTAQAYLQSVLPMAQKGEVIPIFQAGLLDDKGNLVKDTGLPAVMTGKELHEKLRGAAPTGLAWDAYRAVVAASRNYDKSLVLPPGAPDNIKRVYWDAADRLVKDKQFLDQAAASGGGTWTAGESFDKQFKVNFGIDPGIGDWLKKTLTTKYGVVVE